jgi:2-aminoadipate transaminase
MAESLELHMGSSLRFVEPRGGIFIWAESSQKVDSDKLFQAALDSKVLYVPGAAFYATAPNATAMRLSYAAATPEEIKEGVERLAVAFHSAIRQSNRGDVVDV